MSIAQYTIPRLLKHLSKRQTTPFKTLPNRAPFSTRATTPPQERYGIDPYNYTSGRWLRNEKHELELRYINFDFDALSQKILALSNANSITTCEKIEGGSNRVFVFTLDNGRRTVAKLPFKIAGPASLTTLSEVATIKLLQQKTTIPIPQLLDWSADPSNAIGSEYTISEHAAGTNLHFKWPDMTDYQRITCMENIYQRLKDVVEMKFPAYGSIYFADTRPASATYNIDDTFVVGPHCGQGYWNCGSTSFHYHHSQANQGPWPDLPSYSNAQIDTGLARLPPPSSAPDPKTLPPYHGSVQAHLDLLCHARAVLNKMATDPQMKETSGPMLFHPDLHKRNVFVSEEDPAVVTAFLDWQGSAVEPAFWYRWDIPDFAGMKLVRPFQVLPWEEKEEEGEPLEVSGDGGCEGSGMEEEQRKRNQEQKEENHERTQEEEEEEEEEEGRNKLTAKAYTLLTLQYTPTLATPKYIHENIYRPFIHPSKTWTAGLPTLHHELLELRKDWSSLGFEGCCPYPEPSDAELAQHKEDYEMFKTVVEMQQGIREILALGSDGSGDGSMWGERERVSRELCRRLLEGLLEDESVEDAEGLLRTIWPFDVEL